MTLSRKAIMNNVPDLSRWVLAFDSTCGSCSRLSARIGRASGNRLETLPLGSPDVAKWRLAALGPDASWEPTLLRVNGDNVRAWTGRSMIIPLTRRLGMARSVRVVSALGSLRYDLAAQRESFGGDTGLSRKRFLQLGAGAVIAGGIVMNGRVPAYAADPVGTWVDANRNKLPQTYEAIIEYPVDYRRHIFGELSPAVRSSMWTEHLARARKSSPLTVAQHEVLAMAIAVASVPGSFAKIDRKAADVGFDFEEPARQVFGSRQLKELFGTLGPPDPSPDGRPGPISPAVACECASANDLCDYNQRYYCQVIACQRSSTGCGLFYAYACDGKCRSNGVPR